ncbi:MAG: hypothetical protein V3U87_06935 [Methylococcaceae bacterium]
MSGKYWLNKNNGVSIAFEPHFFYLNGNTIQVSNPNNNKAVRIKQLSLGYMFLPVFLLDYEETTFSSGLFEVRGGGFRFSFTNEQNSIEWKRENQHPACLDLQGLKDDYDQQIRKIDIFHQKEKKRANSMYALAIEIDKKEKEINIINNKIPSIDDAFLYSFTGISDEEDFFVPSITPVDYLFSTFIRMGVLTESIKYQKNKKKEIKKKLASMVSQYRYRIGQEEGAKQCSVYRENVKKLYEEMRCKKVEIHPLFQ